MHSPHVATGSHFLDGCFDGADQTKMTMNKTIISFQTYVRVSARAHTLSALMATAYYDKLQK